MPASLKTSNVLLTILVLNLTLLNVFILVFGMTFMEELGRAKKEAEIFQNALGKISEDIQASAIILNRRSEKVVRSLEGIQDYKMILQRRSGKYEITIEGEEEVIKDLNGN